MSDSAPEIPQAVRGALQGSGFPFQTRVRHLILDTQSRWRVHASEYQWRTAAGESQFLDIVATNGADIFLAIECKKARNEMLTFLRPIAYGNTGPRIEAFRCLRFEEGSSATMGGARKIFGEEWPFFPVSTCSEFCVVSTGQAGKERLLEKDAGLVVRATDAFAQDYRERFQHGRDPAPCFFVPVIVTNDCLYTARYRETAVSLETGELSFLPDAAVAHEVTVESVSWVRFRKAFASDDEPDLGDRSVFIVQATSFAKFLEEIALCGSASESGDRGSVSLAPRRWR